MVIRKKRGALYVQALLLSTRSSNEGAKLPMVTETDCGPHQEMRKHKRLGTKDRNDSCVEFVSQWMHGTGRQPGSGPNGNAAADSGIRYANVNRIKAAKVMVNEVPSHVY